MIMTGGLPSRQTVMGGGYFPRKVQVLSRGFVFNTEIVDASEVLEG